MRLRGLVLGLITVAFVATQGCKSAESKGAGDPVATGAPASPPPAGNAGAAAKDDKNDSSFHLAVEPPAAGTAGAEVVAHVVVTPGSGYHVNQEFPTKLVITPPDGVKVAKAEQKKEDAAAFSNDKLQFDVKLTPDKAGTYKVAGTLKFAVCTETSCDPKKREIAFDLAAH